MFLPSTWAFSFIYFPDNTSNKVSVINSLKLTLEDVITVGNGPEGISTSPDGLRVYVVNRGDSTLSVIDTLSHKTVGSPVTVGEQAMGVTVNPDSSRVFVTTIEAGVGKVFVLNADSLAPVDKITVGADPMGVVVSPDGKTLYVTNNGDATVSVVDLELGVEIDIIDLVPDPKGILIHPDGSMVFVEHGSDETVTVIDTSDNSVLQSKDVGFELRGITFNYDASRFLYGREDGWVGIYELFPELSFFQNFLTEFNYKIMGLGFSPDNRLWIGNKEGNRVLRVVVTGSYPSEEIEIGRPGTPFGNFITPDLGPFPSINPNELLFDTPVGSVAEKTVVVSSDGLIPLTITQVETLKPPLFALGFDGCSGVQLNPGDSCEISVTFSPTESDTSYLGSLEISAEELEGPLWINIWGNFPEQKNYLTCELQKRILSPRNPSYFIFLFSIYLMVILYQRFLGTRKITSLNQ